MAKRMSIERVASDEAGATAVEYGLILALIALAAMSAIQLFSGRAIEIWTFIKDTVVANMS